MDDDRLARTIAGILADAEKEGFSYPMHVTVELASGRTLIEVYYANGTVTPVGAVTLADDPRLLPATVEVREWDAAAGKPKEARVLRIEIRAAY